MYEDWHAFQQWSATESNDREREKYLEGQRAYQNGYDYDDCPYSEKSVHAHMWRMGYTSKSAVKS